MHALSLTSNVYVNVIVQYDDEAGFVVYKDDTTILPCERYGNLFENKEVVFKINVLSNKSSVIINAAKLKAILSYIPRIWH